MLDVKKFAKKRGGTIPHEILSEISPVHDVKTFKKEKIPNAILIDLKDCMQKVLSEEERTAIECLLKNMTYDEICRSY